MIIALNNYREIRHYAVKDTLKQGIQELLQLVLRLEINLPRLRAGCRAHDTCSFQLIHYPACTVITKVELALKVRS
jgi:hypothetical protein